MPLLGTACVLAHLEKPGWVFQNRTHCCEIRQVVAGTQHFPMRGILDIEVGSSTTIARPDGCCGVVIRTCDSGISVALRTAPAGIALASVVRTILSPKRERFLRHHLLADGMIKSPVRQQGWKSR